MFEFHGWASIRDTADCADLQVDPSPETIEAIQGLVRGIEDVNRALDVRWANGDVHLWIAGMHNHRRQEIITTFAAVAERAPGSYGVLYVFDDEDEAVGFNNWRRFVMRRGAVMEEPDDLLSPHVGLVEDDCGYDGAEHASGPGVDLSNWVPSENLLPFLEELSRLVKYSFDDGDEAAIAYGVSVSNIDVNEWFDYPLVGDVRLDVSLSRDVNADPVFMRLRIDRPISVVLRTKLETTLEIFNSYRVKDPVARREKLDP